MPNIGPSAGLNKLRTCIPLRKKESVFGAILVRMWQNVDQNNSEYEHFLRSVRYVQEIINLTNYRTWLFSIKYVHKHKFSVYWVREVISSKETYMYLTIYTSEF